MTMRWEQEEELDSYESMSAKHKRCTLFQRLSTYPRLGLLFIVLGVASVTFVIHMTETTEEVFIFVMLIGNLISGIGAFLVAIFLDAEVRRRREKSTVRS